MPAKVKVRILAGRNLPVMDKSSDASDAFVEVKLGNTTYKTEVYRRSLNPFWNSEWFRFEVSDQELQDEPLQIRIMDYDTYSANDAIGKVYINLNPLLLNPGRSMSGWLPIYDTLHGIRGEINCMVKVNLFADNNRYRHSSCGVRFFFSDIPNGYKCDAILGFVDELLVNDDPEYQWIDKIRTPRASNEARQTLFTKLSGEVQRKLGLKAEIFGGNAVIGYQQSFDLEGGSGIVGRGIGTAVVLSKIGCPFDGIISPLFGSNQKLNDPFSHLSSGRQLVSSYSYDRSSTQRRHHQSERQLTHSFSADRKPKQQSRIVNLPATSSQELSINQAGSTSEKKLTSSKSIDENDSPYQATSPLSTTSQLPTQTSISSDQAPSSSSLSQKRRRDKSQSASIDDALSIIEEKNDDEDHIQSANLQQGSQVSPGPRVRLLSGSSNKMQRQMVRTKEIDLNEELPTSVLTRPKGFSISSADDDEADDNVESSATTISSSTLDAKTSNNQSESLLSSSTPSTSLLTEETVRAAKGVIRSTSPVKTSVVTQLSSSTTSSNPVMRRSDTDLTNNSDSKPNADRHRFSQHAPQASTSLSRSESTYTHSDSTNKRGSPDFKHNSKGNFIQTVRTIKAEQKLLQNFVKQQNQNLNPSNKTMKNMFMYPNRVHQSEYPFVTLKRFSSRMIQCTGGVVSVHSVKLLDHIINDEESETRDIWWTEIRKEIRSHAKALNCNTILGYSETSKVIGDVCVLSACGTAAILRESMDEIEDRDKLSSDTNRNLKVPRQAVSPPLLHSTMPVQLNESTENYNIGSRVDKIQKPDQAGQQQEPESEKIDCSFCHSPLTCISSISSLATCRVCKSSKVPDVLLLTIEPPENLNIASTISLIQARVCRVKRDSHGEASAKEIGDALPFLEYELHRQLFSKLKFRGMNCLFNLNVDISVGENMITGIATGTGCYVLGLPTPEPPRISAGKGIKAFKLAEIQRLIAMCAAKNREKLGLEQILARLKIYHEKHAISEQENMNPPASGSIEQRATDVDFLTPTYCQDSSSDFNASVSGENTSSGKIMNKRSHHRHHHHHHHHHHHAHRSKQKHHRPQNFSPPSENLTNLLNEDNNIILEVDDNEDADIIALLIDSDTPEGYMVCNSESIPPINQSSITSINMFTQVMRSKLIGLDQFAQQFDWIMQSLYVKLRRSLPCCLTNVNFVVDLPESHIIQISVTGCLLGLSELPNPVEVRSLVDDQDTLTIKPAIISSPIVGTSTSASSATSLTSSSSSASPTSSFAITSRSSSSSTSSSVKSTKEVQEEQVIEPKQQSKSTEQVKSLTKKLSNSNIASLLKGNKNKARNNTEIELTDRRKEEPKSATTTKATIAAVKQEIQQNRLGHQQKLQEQQIQQQRPTTFFKPVFKKQQTYPGANSPAISGHDKLLPTLDSPTNSLDPQGATLNAATRRATILLNKVKQPLKDLGSNFNSSPSSASDPSTLTPTASSSAIKATNKNAAVNNKSATSQDLKRSATEPSALAITSQSSSSMGTQIATSNATGQVILPKLEVRQSINSSIDITSLSYIPGAKDYHYLGNLSFSFVRETNSVRENGGLNGFIHCFLMEVYAIVRAHVSALGGNAFLSFRLQQSCIFYHSNKNQAQCLISVAGDAVQVTI